MPTGVYDHHNTKTPIYTVERSSKMTTAVRENKLAMEHIRKPRVCLDLHDWSLTHNRLDLLFRLRESFPTFKVSLFTVPVDKVEDWGSFLIRKDTLEIVKGLDWVQLIPHGLYHTGSEMRKCSYETFKNTILPSIEGAFDSTGLPYEKGFCAPHWV